MIDRPMESMQHVSSIPTDFTVQNVNVNTAIFMADSQYSYLFTYLVHYLGKSMDTNSHRLNCIGENRHKWNVCGEEFCTVSPPGHEKRINLISHTYRTHSVKRFEVVHKRQECTEHTLTQKSKPKKP